MDAPCKTMLIVEDEGLIALDLESKLKQAGYSVSSIADSSAAALAAIERERPDLILMDIRLKGLKDGIQTAEEIRTTYDLPVMFVTAHADTGTLERARLAEPYGFIVKPFAGVNFQAQIEMALWKHAKEQKVRQSEAKLSGAVRNLPDALIVTDAQGSVALMNSAATELTGWDLAEAKGRPLVEVLRLLDEKTQFPPVHPLEAFLGDRQIETAPSTFRLLTKIGTSALVEAGFRPITGSQGEFAGTVALLRDITERRGSEERERQIDKMNAITLMATGLARELGDARKQIDGPLNDLMRNASGWELRKLGDVYGGASYQHLLLEQLAALGKTAPEPRSPIGLNETLLAMKKELQRSLGRSRSLVLKLEASVPPILVDPNGLRKNLLRLAAEERDAMPEGGRLELTTRVMAGPNGEPFVELAVRDSGKAVRENARGRVFDPYYQSRPENRNAGMALALLYHFVALNGGSIDVAMSHGPEEGTRFLIRFPVADRFASAGARANPMESAPAGGERQAWRMQAV